MRHLRLFESKKYDNVVIDQEEFIRLYRTSIPFTKSELEKIFDYFYNYESDRLFYSNQPNIGFEWTREFDFGDEKLYRPIFRVEGLKHPMKSGLSRWESVFKLEDHWFLVFDYIGSGPVKYRKCDDLGGLFEYFDVALKDYRISPELADKTRLINLIRSKTKGLEDLSVEELREMARRLSVK